MTLPIQVPRTKDFRETQEWERLVSALGTGISSHAAATVTHGVTTALVGKDDVVELKNKTIDGDLNTVKDLAIAVLKTVIGNASKFLSFDAAGAPIATKAVPAGTVVGTTDAQALSNKTIDGDDNTVQDLAVSVLKTVLAQANTFLSFNASGAPIATKAVPAGAVLGTTDTQGVSNKTMDSTNKYGGATDHSSFEADGTLVFNGAATVWDDSMVPAFDARTAAASLTLASMVGGLYGPRFDLNDEIFGAIQISHRIKTSGTVVIKPHVHLINQNAIGAVTYNVRFEFEWAWGNHASAGLATATNDPQTFSLINSAALTHSIRSFTDITAGAGQGGISSLFFFRLKRITAGGGAAYDTNDIFFGGFDLHFEIDTAGSRTDTAK